MITHYKKLGCGSTWCRLTLSSVENGDYISINVIDCTCVNCLKALQQTINGKLKRFEVYAE